MRKFEPYICKVCERVAFLDVSDSDTWDFAGIRVRCPYCDRWEALWSPDFKLDLEDFVNLCRRDY